MTTLALNTLLFLVSMAAMGAYYCRFDVLKYGVDPLGRIVAHIAGGGASAWALTEAAQMSADWHSWLAAVFGLGVLVATYRYTSVGQMQRAKLQQRMPSREVA